MVVFFEEFCPSNKGVEIIVLSVVYGAYNTGLREPHEITETVFENRFMHVQELNRLRVPIKHSMGERETVSWNREFATENLEQRICKGLPLWRRICIFVLVVSLVFVFFVLSLSKQCIK